MPEEEAFAVLVQLMQEYRLREFFKPSMAELGLCMFQLECMIQVLAALAFYKPEVEKIVQLWKVTGDCAGCYASW